MKIGTILNQKKDMAKEVKGNNRVVVGKNKKAGNFSFTKVNENKARKPKTESADEAV